MCTSKIENGDPFVDIGDILGLGEALERKIFRLGAAQKPPIVTGSESRSLEIKVRSGGGRLLGHRPVPFFDHGRGRASGTGYEVDRQD